MSGTVQHPFAPLMSTTSRILILGSFPSVKSRENQFYYGHPQNRFWRMLSGVFGAPLPCTIEEKTALVLTHHLALWDSIASCTITGSSDASVRDVVPTDIRLVLDHAPIERVLCNGALSARMYKKYLEGITGMPALTLPSTSPANASWSLSRLIEAWGEALKMDGKKA